VSLISIRAETDAGSVAVQGTVVAKDTIRVLGIDGFDVEVGPAERMVVFRYRDRPGIIGKVGTIFGDAGINIATMDVGRRAQGGEALMVLTVDSDVAQTVLDHVEKDIEASNIRTVSFS
jgi:D-3-phosphoglycerate dehydrogenase